MDKINFENLPSTNTPISAENLNQLQTNVETALESKANTETVEEELETKVNVGTVLYENETGTTGGISLNTPIENFKYFEVESYVIYNGEKVYTTTGKLPIANKNRIHLNNIFVGATGLQVYSKRIAMLGTAVSVNSDRRYGSSTSETTDDIYTYITKITGYEN